MTFFAINILIDPNPNQTNQFDLFFKTLIYIEGEFSVLICLSWIIV